MPVRSALLPAALALAACSVSPQPTQPPQFRSFDLKLTHPSPNSTYLLVTPGLRGGDLPRPRQIESRGFARYLRNTTGCAVDPSVPPTVMGDARMPAGYIIPVLCP